jgi:hypothetical protein
MNSTYNLKSILNAIEEINSKQKKTISLNLENNNKAKERTSFSDGVLPITEKLIIEAEEYSKKFKNNSFITPSITEDVLILDKEHNEQNLEIFNLEEIKLNIIDDLYSSLSKKVKKNTLKIIFDLRKQINDLEKKIEVLKISKEKEVSEQYSNRLKFNDNNEHLINEDYLESNNEHLINEDNLNDEEEHLLDTKNSNLTDDTIKTLKQQNLTIKNFEKNEKKLLLRIVDLEQDISLLDKNKLNQPIFKIEKDSDQPNHKTEREIIFYRENYERLIIENNEVKKKLVNAKNQIIIFESNIKELENGFDNLNNILSKNSIIKINESSQNDPLILTSSQEFLDKP